MGLIGIWLCGHVGRWWGLGRWLSWLTPDGTLWTQHRRPLLQWRERDGVFVCVEEEEEEGGCGLAPKRFVSAKRFPCPSQMAGHAPPLAAEEEEQKKHGGRRHTCLCVST